MINSTFTTGTESTNQYSDAMLNNPPPVDPDPRRPTIYLDAEVNAHDFIKYCRHLQRDVALTFMALLNQRMVRFEQLTQTTLTALLDAMDQARAELVGIYDRGGLSDLTPPSAYTFFKDLELDAVQTILDQLENSLTNLADDADKITLTHTGWQALTRPILQELKPGLPH